MNPHSQPVAFRQNNLRMKLRVRLYFAARTLAAVLLLASLALVARTLGPALLDDVHHHLSPTLKGFD